MNCDPILAKRMAAMALVAENAGPAWQAAALSALHDYALEHSGFLIEAVRRYAADLGLPEPHDNRAWGAVTKAGVRLGYIVCEGYRVTGTNNASPKPVWKSLLIRSPLATRE